MKPIKHELSTVWEKHPDALATDSTLLEVPKYQHVLVDYLATGQYYYYVLDIATSSVRDFHPNVLRAHDLNDFPIHLK